MAVESGAMISLTSAGDAITRPGKAGEGTREMKYMN